MEGAKHATLCATTKRNGKRTLTVVGCMCDCDEFHGFFLVSAMLQATLYLMLRLPYRHASKLTDATSVTRAWFSKQHIILLALSGPVSQTGPAQRPAAVLAISRRRLSLLHAYHQAIVIVVVSQSNNEVEAFYARGAFPITFPNSAIPGE